MSWWAFATADKPIGVTSAFENSASLAAKAAVPQQMEGSAYYANRIKENKPPTIDWEWMLVVGVLIGAFASSMISRDRLSGSVPPLWRWRFGDKPAVRYLGAFAGGCVMMLGARIAQGCTSGHGISGTLQLALSSWIFVPTMFLVAVATAFLIYGTQGRRHV